MEQINVDPTSRAYARIGLLSKEVDVLQEAQEILIRRNQELSQELAKYKAEFGELKVKDAPQQRTGD